MWPFPQKHKRSLAVADYFATQLPNPVWSTWNLRSAVKDGYQSSGWVYLAVSKIMQAAASAPLVVRRADNDEIDWQHPATLLLQKPNPSWSRSNLDRLQISWLQLAGNGYYQRVKSGGRTIELWPISPDALAPVMSKDDQLLVDRYEGTQKSGLRFLPDELIHFRLVNPSNPALGIGPLQVAARAVDTDVELSNFNQAAAQNRGVMDGIITIDGSQEQVDVVRESLEERLTRQINKKNARIPAIIGRIGQYIHMGRTPAELDFLGGRSFSRDEIYQIFGIPPVLMGVQESSTYNNMETAPRTFWRETIVPLRLGMADDIDHGLRQGNDELGETHYIGADFSQVPALREDEQRRANISKTYYAIGIPVKQINDMMQIGIDQFDGWDQSWNGTQAPKAGSTEERTKLVNKRDYRVESDLYDQIAGGAAADLWHSILDRQQAVVMGAIESQTNIGTVLSEMRARLVVEINTALTQFARQFSSQLVIESRDSVFNAALLAIITERLSREAIALRVISEADEDTARLIGEQVAELASEGAAVGVIQQAIIDAGVFDPSRALMLARTMTTTAQSIGQISAGQSAGATHKRWVTGGANVRPTHRAAHGQQVGINERFDIPAFSGGFESAEYPGDPNLSTANRANCKCSLTFLLED